MEYSQPVKIPDGRYYIKVTKGGERVFYQLNKMKLLDESLLATKNLTFALPEMACDILSAVEDELMSQAISSKMEWFGKDIANETISKAYQSALEGATFQAPLATVNGQNVVVAYDSRKEAVQLDQVQKDAVIDVLVELSGLWFLKKSFGPIFRIAQIRVPNQAPARKTFPTQYLFDDAQDEVEETESANDYLD
jgi:hypothetical protein